MRESPTIRVGLVGGEGPVRHVLAERLSAADDLVVVLSAGDAEEGLSQAVDGRPDVLVIDAATDGGGSGVCQQFRGRGFAVGCVELAALPPTGGFGPDGVDDVVLKDLRSNRLERAIRRVRAKYTSGGA